MYLHGLIGAPAVPMLPPSYLPLPKPVSPPRSLLSHALAEVCASCLDSVTPPRSGALVWTV